MPRLPLLAMCVLALGCFQDSSAARSKLLPFDYQTSFLSVRSCRLNVAHDNAYQAVFANSVGAEAYTIGSYPLPEGSVIVAEQHKDPSCNSLTGYDLMAKESAGYDATAGDWHWQKLDSNQRVLDDGRLKTCSSCHANPPCSDFLCSAP
jgi:hypothetical protein